MHHETTSETEFWTQEDVQFLSETPKIGTDSCKVILRMILNETQTAVQLNC